MEFIFPNRIQHLMKHRVEVQDIPLESLVSALLMAIQMTQWADSAAEAAIVKGQTEVPEDMLRMASVQELRMAAGCMEIAW